MARHYIHSCGDHPKDSGGVLIGIGDWVAYNRSGDVVGGTVTDIKWSAWKREYAWDYDAKCNRYVDVRYPTIYIENIQDNTVSKVKNTNGIYVI